jgi:hypothetical protein
MRRLISAAGTPADVCIAALRAAELHILGSGQWYTAGCASGFSFGHGYCLRIAANELFLYIGFHLEKQKLT